MRLPVVVVLSLLASVAHAGPWLGVMLEPDPNGGARIVEVHKSSPAEKAKVRANETLVGVDKRPIAVVEDAIAEILAHKPGDTIRLRLRAAAPGTSERTVAVTLVAPPAEEPTDKIALAVVAGPKLASLGALHGKIVVLDFFATWCNPCVREMPHIRQIADELGPKGVVVVGISPEEADVVAGAAKQFSLRHSLVADPDNRIFKRFHVRALPTVIVLDRKGEVRSLGVDSPEELDALLQTMLAEK